MQTVSSLSSSKDSSSVKANSVANSASSMKISSIEKLQENPEFFPLWMEELQRNNINLLMSATSSSYLSGDSGDSTADSLSMLGGSASSSNDPLASFYGSNASSTDPLSGILSSQGLSSMAFMNPASAFQSFEVTEMLEKFSQYNNLKESKEWMGQVVSYKDPLDGLVKSGAIVRIDIENVKEPIFYLTNDVKLSLEDIITLEQGSTAGGTSMDLNNSGSSNQQLLG